MSEEIAFPFRVGPLRIEDSQGETFEVHTYLYFDTINIQKFFELYNSHHLRIGMKIFETSSNSAVHADLRAREVQPADNVNGVRIVFSIPRKVFAEQQCRIVQVDLVYEGVFWFEHKLGAPPFLPMWVEKPAEEIDVFNHYFSKYA